MIPPTPTILVVDDSPQKRYIISSWLRRGGYDVVEAQTGAQALETIDATPVDLVVLDVRLPDLSGFEVCEQIKGNPAHAATPVIHVSAAAVDMTHRTQGLARGADAYLVEPIDPDELLATVHAILRYYRGRQVAERLAARLSTLARLAVELNRATSARRLLADAATGTARIYQSAAMVCAETTEEGWLAAFCPGPDAPAVLRPWSPRVGQLPRPGRYAELALSLPAVLGWPEESTVDVLSAVSRPDRSPVYVMVPSGAIDPGAPVLTLLGQTVAGSMETLRAYTLEHQLALTLQQSLLPQRLPRVPGVDLAKRYVPASDIAEIGGDFYELSYLDDVLVVAVGDVGGHSLHAATVMAELRHAMRAYVVEGHAPAAVIDRLDTLMHRLLPEEIATLCLLTMRPDSGQVCLANAGHPGPLLVVDGTVTQLTEHGTLLGLRSPPARQHEFVIPAGATLVLYTDGLVERRDEPIDAGIERLMAAAAFPEPDLDAYCERLVRTVGPASPLDDIAVVALRRHDRS
jgi:DNA-binding response OmpR family regulator